ncbi:hypothetical protein ACFYZB_25455 [Streptomyces sp. NPDC001852]|uniref:MmyB family transcriptional regulator n=1 Tax=Streptomyces sp. NPDC001852 TaxID=3364619 RepID=UPI00368CAF3C
MSRARTCSADPAPALVVDRRGDLVAANDTLDVLTEGAAPERVGPGRNVHRLALHPQGLAPRIGNLAEWPRHILAASAICPSYGTNSAHTYRDWGRPPITSASAVPLRVSSSCGELRLLTTFVAAVDVTLAELELEASLPAAPAVPAIQPALATAAAHRDIQRTHRPAVTAAAFSEAGALVATWDDDMPGCSGHRLAAPRDGRPEGAHQGSRPRMSPTGRPRWPPPTAPAPPS